MPIYEYQCRGCSAQFELLVLRSTVLECPTCQSRDLEHLLSGFAVSSSGTRSANAQSARRANLNNANYRDQKVAENEYIKKHPE
jgi:putative FmdB family regulatory protein